MRGLFTGAFLAAATTGLGGCAVEVTVKTPTVRTITERDLTLQETWDRCEEFGGNVCASFEAKAQSDAKLLADYKAKRESGVLPRIPACETAGGRKASNDLDFKSGFINACIDGINAGMGRQYITVRR